jgi:hypothetical protein
MPARAASWVLASQLRLGNSAHNPTYSLSSSDQVTRYVYLSIIHPQQIDCFKNLPDLVCLCLAFVVLNIDSRIAGPGRSINIVTSLYARFPEVVVTDYTKLLETNTLRILPHRFDYFLNSLHVPDGIIIATISQIADSNTV